MLRCGRVLDDHAARNFDALATAPFIIAYATAEMRMAAE